MKLTLIKGIGQATEKELNKIGIYSLEDLNEYDKVALVRNTNIPTGKLMKIMEFYKVEGATPEAIERIRAFEETRKNDKLVGTTLTDYNGDIIKIMEVLPNGWYQIHVKSEVNTYNRRMPIEEIKDLMSKQDKINGGIKKQQERESKEKAEAEAKVLSENAENQRCMIGGFLDGKTAMQKAKIMQQLDKMVRYDGQIVTFKSMIFDKIMNKNGKVEFVMREYEEKKRNGEYKKLSNPKKELYVTFFENGDEIYSPVNKTQYDYAEYLVGRK